MFILSPAICIPEDRSQTHVKVDGREVGLTNLRKPFWPELGITKGDLLRYYGRIGRALLPHLVDRAMVMKRYPNGAAGDFFFQKRAPSPRPDWIEICSIEHASGNIVDFPVVRDMSSLLWTINLGCIDLNPWYARCDDVDRPDYLHFDLDPVGSTPFSTVLEAARLVHEALDFLSMKNMAKTSGSRGVHIYVPIVRDPTQKQVWAFAKEMAKSLEQLYPDIITAEYRVEKRPAGRVLVDYNQNAWGRTLASVYSVRPTSHATVSAPISWAEVEKGLEIADFRIDNVPARVDRLSDLWAELLSPEGRFDLSTVLPLIKGRAR
jgi:bifunctional non-homologous end joining protein LigD